MLSSHAPSLSQQLCDENGQSHCGNSFLKWSYYAVSITGWGIEPSDEVYIGVEVDFGDNEGLRVAGSALRVFAGLAGCNVL